MKTKKVVAGLCIGLMLTVYAPKPVQAEPITTTIVLHKIMSGIIFFATVAGFWVAIDQAAKAEVKSATESSLKHLGNSADFPVSGNCISPSINNGTTQEAWLVSIDDKKLQRSFVKSDLCQAGGIHKIKGKYTVGAFTSKYHAKNFAKVVQDRTENEIPVYVSEEALILK
ncbi:MAG: hypothetical protein NWQ28_03670 [Nodularia sp. (in: cyanobacteria)]|nr:hypothetical protein [Nodularia sp. (in: cyanobacteria)]